MIFNKEKFKVTAKLNEFACKCVKCIAREHNISIKVNSKTLELESYYYTNKFFAINNNLFDDLFIKI